MNAWTAAGQLPADSAVWQVGLIGMHTLADGRVLLAGGEDAHFVTVASAALFDPATLTWTATGSMTQPRSGHAVTRLANGKVLATGGMDKAERFPFPGTASSELFDPATGTWTSAAPMTQARWGHTASLLADGRVLVAGGGGTRDSQSAKSLASAEVYDPATDSWTPVAPMTDARLAHHAVLLDDGRVLVVGGGLYTGRGLLVDLALCELFDPATRTWTPTGGPASARLAHQTTKLADGTVLITGGWSTQVVDGAVFDTHSQHTVERFDPATGKWGPAASMPTPRCFHQAVRLQSGDVLVIGGTDNATEDVGYRNVIRYNPATDTWAPAAALLTGRYGHAAAILADGRVLTAAGVSKAADGGQFEGDNQIAATAEIYTDSL